MRARKSPLRVLSSNDRADLAIHDLGGDGRGVLLAHATGFNGAVWRPFAAALAPWRCVAPDLRGHGASPIASDRPLDWDGFADDVLTAVDAMGLKAPIGVGHSKGGAALLRAEARRPGTFAALWCYEPIVFPGPFPVDVAQLPPNPLVDGALRRRDHFDSRAEAYDNYAGKAPMADFDAEALAGYVEHGLVDDPSGGVRLACRPEVEAEVYRTGALHNTFDRLTLVRCPVAIACGGEASPPAQLSPAIAEALPDGRLHRFEHRGHFAPLEQPSEMAADVRAFVEAALA